MALAIALVLIGGLAVAMMVMAGLERGPSPEDVAVSYEQAWDRLDFESLWVLSGRELRDGLKRGEFLAAKRAAYAASDTPKRLAAAVAIEGSAARNTDATVITRLDMHDGSSLRDEVRLRRRNSRWEVVAYSLARPANASA